MDKLATTVFNNLGITSIIVLILVALSHQATVLFIQLVQLPAAWSTIITEMLLWVVLV